MCTPLQCQAHFGQNGSRAERQTRRTAVFFVVALCEVRGSPKGRISAPGRVLKALKKKTWKTKKRPKNGGAPNTVFYETKRHERKQKRHERTNRGPLFSENEAPLQPQTLLRNLGELGTGSTLGLECCASICDHSHGCPRSPCDAGKAQETARTPPRASLMGSQRP